MDENRIKLEVVTPEQAVLSEEVGEVVLPGSTGQLGILPGHLPLLTGLSVGEMVIRHTEGRQRRFFVDQGFAEVLDDKVSVLTQGCEGVSDIDIERAREDISVAEEQIDRLEAKTDIEDEEEELLERYRESLQHARTRLLLADESSAEDE